MLEAFILTRFECKFLRSQHIAQNVPFPNGNGLTERTMSFAFCHVFLIVGHCSFMDQKGCPTASSNKIIGRLCITGKPVYSSRLVYDMKGRRLNAHYAPSIYMCDNTTVTSSVVIHVNSLEALQSKSATHVATVFTRPNQSVCLEEVELNTIYNLRLSINPRLVSTNLPHSPCSILRTSIVESFTLDLDDAISGRVVQS